MKELEFQEEWLSAYLDDELTVEQRQVVEQRLASDPAAQATLDDLRRVREMVSKLPSWSGSDLKFTIPNELPGDYDEDSMDQQTVASSDLSTVSDDFDAVPSSLEDPVELQVHSTGPADWNDRSTSTTSTSTNRSWLTWLATAASVLLILGAGYVFWPREGLVVSQLDSGMSSAAPMIQSPMRSEFDAEPMREMGRDSAVADPSNVAAEFNYKAESSSQSGSPSAHSKMSEPSEPLSAPGSRGLVADSPAASDQQYALPLAGKAFEQPQKDWKDSSPDLSMRRAPENFAPNSPSADVASNMFGAASEAETKASEAGVKGSEADAKDREALLRQRAESAPNEKLSLPELNNAVTAELPQPAPASAMADKSQMPLGGAGVEGSKRLAEPTDLPAQPLMKELAQRARYARSANVSDVNELQQAASQTTVFFGQNALKIDAASLSTKADEQPQQIPEVLMATLNVDRDKADSLFDSVVTSNQLLTVEESAVKQNAVEASQAFSKTARSDPKDASTETTERWYFEDQLSFQKLPSVSSLVLFVTRDEANRILEELKRQGQIDAPVWQVTQRSAAESQRSNLSSAGGMAGTNLAAGNLPAGNVPAGSQAVDAARVAEPRLERGRAEMDFVPSAKNGNASKAKAMGEAADRPADQPADSDRVILMLNTAAR